VGEWIGWRDEETPEGEVELREKVCATVLLADLINADPSLANRFPFVPADQHKRQVVSELAKRWRDSRALQPIYREFADKVESKYDLKGIITLNEAMLSAETFKAIDDLWMQELRRAVRPDGSNFREKVERLKEIAKKRKGLFWSNQDDAIKNFWEAVYLAAKIWVGCHDALKLSERLQNVDKFISHYTDENGWWLLDFWALQLAAKQVWLSEEDKGRLVKPVWAVYRQFLDSVNRAFVNAVKREGWRPTQPNFWQNIRFGQEKVAVFFVDALRFDLARHLQERIGNAVEFRLNHLMGVLPSITEIGMAALLPEATSGLSVAWENNRLVVKVQGQKVGSRREREDWLKQHIGANGKVVDLDDLGRISVDDVQVLIVISRELDEFGTFASGLHPQGILEMVDRIAQGIRLVTEKGFRKVFVVADHGFLFAPEECEPFYVQAPSAMLTAKRRFIVGGQSEGCLVVRANEIGLQGELLFAFPEGFSVVALQGERETFLHGGLSLQESVIPMLIGQAAVIAPKVEVRVQIQEPISSRILRVVVEAKIDSLFAEPRKVKVRVGNRESNIVEVSAQSQREEISFVWLDEFEEPPPKTTVQLIDADTNQVLDQKDVQVNLLV